MLRPLPHRRRTSLSKLFVGRGFSHDVKRANDLLPFGGFFAEPYACSFALPRACILAFPPLKSLAPKRPHTPLHSFSWLRIVKAQRDGMNRQLAEVV